MARGCNEYFDGREFVKIESKLLSVNIPIAHWQLRHFISYDHSDIIYYASRAEVYSLNVVTKQRALLSLLPFDARCTASGFGWICVGGGEEPGHFATIKVDGCGEVDAALPIDAWRRRPASLKVQSLGDEIVNSISIHRIQEEDSHLDDIVAVVTNNDKTVRIYSLPLGVETAVLRSPYSMNHATISPCGTMLVAVGDYNEAYFYRRVLKDTPPLIPKPHNRLTSASVDWELIQTRDLYLHNHDSTKGYFTTAWSPDGCHVAVGSEEGYITVFDVQSIKAQVEDPVVAIIASSRAGGQPPYAGAVRTMIFSPAPWDLLIWSEDQGRICVADLKSGLLQRQTLELEPEEATLEKLQVGTAPLDGATQNEIEQSLQEALRRIEDMEAEFQRRYRRSGSSMPNFASGYFETRNRQRQRLGASTQTHQLRNAGSSRILPGSQFVDDPRGLTSDEQQILESLRTTRQREEARGAGRARGVNYTTAEAIATARSSASSTPSSVSRNSTAEAVNRLDLHDEALSEAEDLTLTRMNHISRQPSRPASADASRPERPRTVILPTPPIAPPATASVLADQAQLSPAPEPESDDRLPWDTIQDAMSLARGPLFESAGRVRTETPLRLQAYALQELTDRQALNRRRAGYRNAQMSLSTLRNGGVTTPARLPVTASFDEYRYRLGTHRELGVRTTGLAMSRDGSTLWAACEKGIFEFKMNQKSLLFWAAVAMR